MSPGGIAAAESRGWPRRLFAGAGVAFFYCQCTMCFLSVVPLVPKQRQKAGWVRCPCHVPDLLC